METNSTYLTYKDIKIAELLFESVKGFTTEIHLLLDVLAINLRDGEFNDFIRACRVLKKIEDKKNSKKYSY